MALMKPDWLTLRFGGAATERLTRDSIATWTIAGDHLQLYQSRLYPTGQLDVEPVGQLRVAHGGLHLITSGQWWRTRPAAAAMRAATDMMLTILDLEPAEYISCPRIDWAVEHAIGQTPIPDQLRTLDHLAGLRLATLHPHRPQCTSWHQSDDGITLYRGFADTDPGRFRARDIVLRTYWRTGAPQIRQEIEIKRLTDSTEGDHDTLHAQLSRSIATASVVLDATPDHDLIIDVDTTPASRSVTAAEAVARIAGMTRGAWTRQHPDHAGHLPGLLTAALRILATELHAPHTIDGWATRHQLILDEPTESELIALRRLVTNTERRAAPPRRKT